MTPTAKRPGCTLVTGGAGFIGGHIALRLVADGWQVGVLVDFSSGRASNLAAYENDETLPKREEQKPDILSPYAAQKCSSELYLRLSHDLYGLETVALRYFNVYGPRQDPKSDYAAVVPLFISAALREQPLRIHGDGEQTISSCVGRDVDVDVDVEYEDERAGDVRHSWADIDRTRAALGFEPSVDLQSGLARTVERFRGVLD